jgi:hypothetical protein
MITFDIISLVVGGVSTVLALFALIFGWIVHREHNRLNIEFTKNLSEINLRSFETNRMVSNSIDRIVDELFNSRRQTIEPIEHPESSETVSSGDQAASLARLERIVSNLQQTVEESILRQRLLQTGGLASALDDQSNKPVQSRGDRRRIRFPTGTRVINPEAK